MVDYVRPDGMTLAECAEVLGCTNRNVSAIEQRALKKLRARLEAAGYRVGDVEERVELLRME